MGTLDFVHYFGSIEVCNALDNMEARFYVDSQCVKYELSLLESGTMGPSGLTPSFKAEQNLSLPHCTIQSPMSQKRFISLVETSKRSTSSMTPPLTFVFATFSSSGV